MVLKKLQNRSNLIIYIKIEILDYFIKINKEKRNPRLGIKMYW